MGPDLDVKNKSMIGKEIFACKENVSTPQDPKFSFMQCVTSCLDKSCHVEGLNGDQAKAAAGSEDTEVNIIDGTNVDDGEQIEGRFEEATESTSSFGDTESETNGGSVFSDTEVDSPLLVGGGPMSIFDGCGGAFPLRKKKLTYHWRRFIRSLMWRCKWVELQIKEFQSQALKYDREIAEIEQMKQFHFETFAAEGFPVKSLPFSTCTSRKKVMKRKKRKRLEETMDVASYMLHHNLFSYYENKKSAIDGASVDEDYSDLAKEINHNDEVGFNDGLTSLQCRDDINEHVLRQIEVLKSLVHKLKARIGKVASENSGKFSSVNALSISGPSAALTNSEQNPTSVPENDRMAVGSLQNLSQHVSAAVSSHGGSTSRSDMIESTRQPQGGVSWRNVEEGVRIHNDSAKEKIRNVNFFDTGLPLKPPAPIAKQTVVSSDPDLSEEMLVARVRYGGKSVPKSSSNNSQYRRKRGWRK